MNRRKFLAAITALPLVGKLFGGAPIARTGLVSKNCYVDQDYCWVASGWNLYCDTSRRPITITFPSVNMMRGSKEALTIIKVSPDSNPVTIRAPDGGRDVHLRKLQDCVIIAQGRT